MRKPLVISEEKYKKMLDNLSLGYELMIEDEIEDHKKLQYGCITVLMILLVVIGVAIYETLMSNHIIAIVLGSVALATSLVIIPLFIKERRDFSSKIKAIENLYEDELGRIKKLYDEGQKYILEEKNNEC